eukprot:TRINITY_DN3799_c0_g3_i1.p1 TRINITY_DN3799_c0_g3~~TRINITY_DN3799_c0_g3_i1.p1  ORF type:complete len:818 (+),score=127.32 TRINITY_DN3799_c0_g3_i1:59-2512(+)
MADMANQPNDGEQDTVRDQSRSPRDSEEEDEEEALNLLSRSSNGMDASTAPAYTPTAAPQFDKLMSALQESVRSSINEAVDEVMKDMLISLRDLSAALKLMCECSTESVCQSEVGEDRSRSSSRSGSLSGSRSGSGESYRVRSPEHKVLPETVRRALAINIPCPGSASAASSSAARHGVASSAAIGKLSPIASRSASEACTPSECHRRKDSKTDSTPGFLGPSDILQEEPKVEEEVLDDSPVKGPDAKPKTLKSAGNMAECDELIASEDAIEGTEHKLGDEAPARRRGSDVFFEFERLKAEQGNRTPCALSAMEDDCLLLSMGNIRRRQRSRKRTRHKKHRDFARVVPGNDDCTTGLQQEIPENQEPCSSNDRKEGRGPSKHSQKGRSQTYAAGDCSVNCTSSGQVDSIAISKKLRSLDQLRSDHAQNILDDYTGVKQPGSTLKQKCMTLIGSQVESTCSSFLCIGLKEFPEYCLAAFGITQLGDRFLSKCWVKVMALVRIAAAMYIIGKHVVRLAESGQVFYTSSVHAVLALGASVSMLCLREGNSKALLGGHCDAIKMYAAENYFLDAWRTRCGVYFCFVVITCAVQSMLFVHRFSGSVAEECEEVGLGTFEPTMHLAKLLVTATMAMLVFLHLRMCAGLDLMVDSFCEDFKMGMDDMRAASDWSTINGLMNKATSTLGTSFLIQISTFAAALVPAAADVLTGNVQEGSLCSMPWLVNWVIPALLGFGLIFVALVQSGRLSLKCSCVAGFVSTVRYKEGMQKDARDLRQYLVNYIHQTSSGFLIQGFRVTTFAAFKLGWCFLTAAFAVWARSRST